MMNIAYYDRQGRPLPDPLTDRERWEREVLPLMTPEYKRVAEDYVPGPNGTTYYVSTVWLGLDHNWDGGPPLIFETTVFPYDAGGTGKPYHSERHCARYTSEAEAQVEHQTLVTSLRINPNLLEETGAG